METILEWYAAGAWQAYALTIIGGTFLVRGVLVPIADFLLLPVAK